MARGSGNGVILGQLRALFDEGAVAGLSDGELLGRFLDDRGESGEAAFGALVRRHGPLVFGVCRRALKDSHRSEDAFQATFLVLARRARSIRNREAVGAWLVGVAGKVAARARGDMLRKRALEGQFAGEWPERPAVESVDRDEVAILLEEVGRLRRPLREAVVLCHLQGLTYLSAADQLGVSEGAIRGRLARARERLRSRLARRGLAGEASASLMIAARSWGPPPARLVGPTARAALRIASGRAVTGVVPGSVATLAEGAWRSMMTAKIKMTAILVLGIGLATLGAPSPAQPVQKAAKPNGKHEKPANAADGAAELAKIVEGRVVRSADLTKDCMVISYIPGWNLGNVDNIGISNGAGGSRTIVDWADVPAAEAKSADLKFYLALYSRTTTARPKPGPVLAFEVEDDAPGRGPSRNQGWPELTSWNTKPSCGEEPIGTYKFEPGEGWKLFDITPHVREKGGKSGRGLMLRFLNEDKPGAEDWSGYQFVSREGQEEWAGRRPRLLVVDPTKK